MTPELSHLITYSRRRVRFDVWSIFEIIGILGAFGLGAGVSYVGYWFLFG